MKWLLAVALALAAPTARASEYNLDQARAIVARSEAARLVRAGVRTTLDLLVTGRTAAGRARLARKTGLALSRIEGFVMLADLMRIRGIGPDVARLLTAAGVRTLADLQGADPTATEAAVRAVNARRHLSTNPPRAESISAWIAEARTLPVVLE